MKLQTYKNKDLDPEGMEYLVALPLCPGALKLLGVPFTVIDDGVTAVGLSLPGGISGDATNT